MFIFCDIHFDLFELHFITFSTNAEEISTSKQYLTSKLVEDSLKWQRDKRSSQSQFRGLESKSPSPYSSPVHRGAVAQSMKLQIPRPQKLNVSSSAHGTLYAYHIS